MQNVAMPHRLYSYLFFSEPLSLFLLAYIIEIVFLQLLFLLFPFCFDTTARVIIFKWKSIYLPPLLKIQQYFTQNKRQFLIMACNGLNYSLISYFTTLPPDYSALNKKASLSSFLLIYKEYSSLAGICRLFSSTGFFFTQSPFHLPKSQFKCCNSNKIYPDCSVENWKLFPLQHSKCSVIPILYYSYF